MGWACFEVDGLFADYGVQAHFLSGPGEGGGCPLPVDPGLGLGEHCCPGGSLGGVSGDGVAVLQGGSIVPCPCVEVDGTNSHLMGVFDRAEAKLSCLLVDVYYLPALKVSYALPVVVDTGDYEISCCESGVACMDGLGSETILVGHERSGQRVQFADRTVGLGEHHSVVARGERSPPVGDEGLISLGSTLGNYDSVCGAEEIEGFGAVPC